MKNRAASQIAINLRASLAGANIDRFADDTPMRGRGVSPIYLDENESSEQGIVKFKRAGLPQLVGGAAHGSGVEARAIA